MCSGLVKVECDVGVYGCLVRLVIMLLVVCINVILVVWF